MIKVNLLLLILFLIILFLFIYFMNKFKIIQEDFNGSILTENYKYYRCSNKLLGTILKDIFDKNNIENTVNQNDNWNIYIPCGYNDVEEELKKISIKPEDSQNKYIFGVNGCDSIVSKNRIWESLVQCFGRKEASTLMPESYILEDVNEMEIFRKNFNPSMNEIYILKKNIQRKEGLKLTKDYFEIIREQNSDYKVVQKYIKDLYLINGRKVNLRIYLLIIVKNNKKYFYLCKIGKCIYTNKKYDDNDFDFESNITSYNLDMSVYEENPRNFNELIEYINNDMPYHGIKLFEKIENLIKKISICLSKNIYQSKNIMGSVTFQLFGIDIIFDKELHPYLLEMNKGPDMSPRDDIDKTMKETVQRDMFKKVGIIKNDDNNSFYLIHSSS